MEVEQEAPLVRRMEKKLMKKKKTRDHHGSSGVTDDKDAVPNLAEDDYQLNKAEKNRDKRTSEIGSESCDVVVCLKDSSKKADDHHQIEKDKKKKKKEKKERRLEHIHKDQPNDETNNAEEETPQMLMDDGNVMKNLGEVKEKVVKKKRVKEDDMNNGKEQNKKKRKVGRDDEDRFPKGNDNSVDVEMGEEGDKISQKESSVQLENGEEQTKKKKKKKERRNEEDGVIKGEEKFRKDEDTERIDFVLENQNSQEKSFVQVKDDEVQSGRKKKKKKVRRDDEGHILNVKDKSADVEEDEISPKESSVQMEKGQEQTEKKKKKKVRRSEADGDVKGEENSQKDEDIELTDGVLQNKISQEGSSIQVGNEEEQTGKKKKKKKVRRNENDDDSKKKDKSSDGEMLGTMKNLDTNISEKVKKKNSTKKKNDNNLGENKVTAHPNRNTPKDKEANKSKKGKEKETRVAENGSKDSQKEKKRKRVSFSGHDEVFPSSSDAPGDGLVRGKRFTPEEDKIIKEAVFKYVEDNDLGEDGVNMVLHCKSHPKIKNCWQDIALALPFRPYRSVYDRAHILFERDAISSWSSEDFEFIRNFHDKHGPKWKQLAETMGRSRTHLKDQWRRIKLLNQVKGNWSQQEYQNLFDLVNVDLKAKASEEKKSKYGMLRDNIGWTAISDKLQTRSFALCCRKWYQQLTSPMVKEGEWQDSDDYHLIDALYNLDACCMEDVDWDNLLEHRSGDVCRKRWNQMTNHIGEHGKNSFSDQVEILSKRYCPELLEAREAWDSKPVVD